MAKSKSATLQRIDETGVESEGNLIELLPEFPYPGVEDHIVAGSGACRACKSEGRNPKTGGVPCGGYIKRGFSADCDNCGHASTQHV